MLSDLTVAIRVCEQRRLSVAQVYNSYAPPHTIRMAVLRHLLIRGEQRRDYVLKSAEPELRAFKKISSNQPT
jgi:hypothetical protein